MKLQVVLDRIPIYFRFYVWGLNTFRLHKKSQVAAQAPPCSGLFTELEVLWQLYP